MFSQKEIVTLSILLGSIFIAFLGIGLVIPALPSLMNELQVTGTIAGYLVAAFAFVQLIASPFTGKMVDSYGRKLMIVIGLIIFGVSEGLFGFGKNVELLFISRMLGGLSAACIMPAVTAFIYDVTPPEKLAKVLGYMSASISTGFIIGPGIGGFLAEISIRLPFYTAGVLGLLAAVIAGVFLTEPERKSEEIKEVIVQKSPTGWKKIFVPMFFIAFLLIFVSSFGLAIFESLFSLFVDHKFAFTPKDIAIVITGGAIIGAIGQVWLFDPLVKRMGEIKLIRYALLASAIFAFLMTVVTTYWTILFTTFFLFVGFDLMRPAITSYLSKIAGNEQGFVSGMNSMFTSIGNILGPVLGGIVFDINLNYPYYSATIIILLGYFITFIWKKPHTKSHL